MFTATTTGSERDRDIREFQVDGDGMHIGSPVRAVGGILTGQVVSVPNDEISPLN